MATNEAHVEMVTVASIAYPGTAQFPDQGYAGFLSIVHLGVVGDPDLIISFDGTTDHERLRVGTAASALASQVPQYRTVWARLSAAGSVAAKIAIEKEGRR